MINTLFVLNIVIVLILIGLVLVQKSEGGVLGMGGGSKNALFTTSSAGSLVTKMTYVFGGLFFAVCLLLAFLVARRTGTEKSFVQNMEINRGTRNVATPGAEEVPEEAVKKQLQEEDARPAAPVN